MSFFSVLFALALEQFLSLKVRSQIQLVFIRYANALERHLNAGEIRHGVVAWALAVLPWAVLVGLVYWGAYQIHPVLGWVWNLVVLYLMMGFRQFSHAFTVISEALRNHDLEGARKALAEWRGGSGGVELNSGEIARLAIEQGLADAHRHVFGTLFWFIVLPGPAGAVLYRLSCLLANKWVANDESPLAAELKKFGYFAERFFFLIDWVPVRLTALSFAIVGDFEDAVFCWRTQAAAWMSKHQGILLASGAGAIGVRLGEPLREVGGGLLYRPDLGLGDPADADYMQSTVGLVWRTVLLWLLLILLISLANWLG